jgi:hypothetical protein
VAQMAWSSLHGLIALHIAKGQDEWIEWRDLRTMASRMSEALMRGMLRRPGD